MVFTPMISSEKLAQTIADTFDPEALEHNLFPIIYNVNVRKNLQSTSDACTTDILFAKERENLWRDEIYQWGLYLQMISTYRSRQMSMEIKSQENTILENWTADAGFAIKEVVEMKNDIVLGWSHDIDVFETVMKVVLLVEVLLRYGRGGIVSRVLEELKNAMTTKESHEFWIEKVEEIFCGVGVQKRVSD